MINGQGERQGFTIEDIARELGVSKTTVSRAISGKGRLSEETRARVLAFIEEHNYLPNAVAQSLARSRTYNLGVVMPRDCSAMEFSFFKDCMTGICVEAQEHNYDVLVVMADGQSTARMEQIIANRKVDGVIVSRSRTKSPIVELLKRKNLPFIVVGDSSDPDVLCVDNANREACRDLSTLLISRGERKMALMCGDESLSVTRSRYLGFQDACVRAGLIWEEQLVLQNVYNRECVAHGLEEILRQGATCVVCMDEFICSMLISLLRERGIKIPDQMRIACFYDSSMLEDGPLSVTSVRFDSVALGRAACKKLLYRIQGRSVYNEVMPEYQLILRDSTK